MHYKGIMDSIGNLENELGEFGGSLETTERSHVCSSNRGKLIGCHVLNLTRKCQLLVFPAHVIIVRQMSLNLPMRVFN